MHTRVRTHGAALRAELPPEEERPRDCRRNGERNDEEEQNANVERRVLQGNVESRELTEIEVRTNEKQKVGTIEKQVETLHVPLTATNNFLKESYNIKKII